MSKNNHEDEASNDTPFDLAITAHLQGRKPPMPLEKEEQQLFEDLSPWFDTLHFVLHDAALELKKKSDLVSLPKPSLRDDPVAHMLGLIPDHDYAIEGFKLREARKSAGLNLGQFLDRLRIRGWDVTAREGLDWEQERTSLPPALIVAICSELRVDERQILAKTTSRSALEDLLDDQRIAAFLDEWAIELNIERSQVKELVSAALSTAGRRNSTVGSVDTLLDVLKTLRAVPGFLHTL